MGYGFYFQKLWVGLGKALESYLVSWNFTYIHMHIVVMIPRVYQDLVLCIVSTDGFVVGFPSERSCSFDLWASPLWTVSVGSFPGWLWVFLCSFWFLSPGAPDLFGERSHVNHLSHGYLDLVVEWVSIFESQIEVRSQLRIFLVLSLCLYEAYIVTSGICNTVTLWIFPFYIVPWF